MKLWCLSKNPYENFASKERFLEQLIDIFSSPQKYNWLSIYPLMESLFLKYYRILILASLKYRFYQLFLEYTGSIKTKTSHILMNNTEFCLPLRALDGQSSIDSNSYDMELHILTGCREPIAEHYLKVF